ncbi:hypothetical protein [Kitasatospora viridis]|uniref:Uncharacterized protein n=1 Tax=Kitasatospora viridis TaxID=281105 RepID=A0A561TSZ3_9ACTN|nr:hypothetical protein [Kitasatospora viridis]TWF90236.1 hypothetical protein FHX73_13280 [Kitasatospora viridis]
MSHTFNQLTGIVMSVAFFIAGLFTFQGIITLPPPSRPYPTFERVFPKFLGGFGMAMGVYGVICAILALV